ERFIADSRYHHRRFEELIVRPAHRRDCMLPGIDRERRCRWGGYFDNVQRGDRDHDGDRFRYALQHRLHRILSHMTTPTHMVEMRDVCMQFKEKKVLDGLSIDVQPQERLVTMRQSGSAMSMILRLTLGTARPTSSSIVRNRQ